MQETIKVEELEDYKARITYTADPDMVAKKRLEALDQLRDLPVPGFRPGKATDTAIKLKYKDKINTWVIGQLVSTANDDILYQTKIRPLGQPEILSTNLKDKTFTLEAIYNKKPEFELSQYKELEVPEPHMSSTLVEKENEFLRSLREKHGEARAYEENDFVEAGDKITIEYELSDGTKEEGKLYQVGSNAIWDDSNLLGMAPGDVREFESKVGKCKVQVHMGLKNTLHPLDEELAKKCGVQSVDELLSTVKIVADNQLKQERNGKLLEQIKRRLLEMNKFEAPNWLVEQDVEYVAKQQGVIFSQLNDDVKEDLRRQARDDVRFTLIIDSIKQAEPDVQMTDMEAFGHIKNMLVQRGVPVANIEAAMQNMQKSGQLAGLVEKVKNDTVLDFLINKAKITN